MHVNQCLAVLLFALVQIGRKDLGVLFATFVGELKPVDWEEVTAQGYVVTDIKTMFGFVMYMLGKLVAAYSGAQIIRTIVQSAEAMTLTNLA